MICVGLKIAPYRINPEEWKHAYWDSLKIIRKFGLSEPCTTKNHGVNISYGAPSEHRELSPGEWGWHSIGDLSMGETMESFSLLEDVTRYRKGDAPLQNNGKDILLNYLHQTSLRMKPEGVE